MVPIKIKHINTEKDKINLKNKWFFHQKPDRYIIISIVINEITNVNWSVLCNFKR